MEVAEILKYDDLTRSEYKVLNRSRHRNEQTDQQREAANKKKEYRESIGSEKRKEILAESKPYLIDGIVTLLQNKKRSIP